MNTHKLAIIGAGQMGRGIAQVAIMKGISVWLYDNRKESAQQATSFIQHQFARGVEKGKWSQSQVAEWIKCLHTTHQLSDLSSVDIVIEAATEDKIIKYELFSNLDRILPPHALLLSNTSSISITELASKTKRPDKVAGMHFMNPVPVMKLVEGIAGLQTSLETMKTVQNLSEHLGKVFIQVQDAPGFVVNRILMPMINEAVYALSEGLASKEEIDQGMKLGTNCPMGPLELADFIGLDTCLSIMEVLYDGLGDSKYRPCPLLKNMWPRSGWEKNRGEDFMNTVLFETEYLLVEREEHLGFLTIRRPEKFNALNTQILKDLKFVLKKFHKEGEGFEFIRTLAIKGEGGKAFVAGADLEELSHLQEEDAYEFALLGQNVTFLLERIPCPVFALIDGYALGGGLELALSCDFLWATESSRFGLPEVKLGLVPGFGGTQRLSRMVGRQMAKDLIFTGRMIQAQEALQIGLVGKVVPSMSKLMDDLKKKHEEVQMSAPLSLAAAKMAINQGIDLPLSEGMNLELDEFSYCFRTEDMREGVKAYLEKRQPHFKGK